MNKIIYFFAFALLLCAVLSLFSCGSSKKVTKDKITHWIEQSTDVVVTAENKEQHTTRIEQKDSTDLIARTATTIVAERFDTVGRVTERVTTRIDKSKGELSGSRVMVDKTIIKNDSSKIDIADRALQKTDTVTDVEVQKKESTLPRQIGWAFFAIALMVISIIIYRAYKK